VTLLSSPSPRPRRTQATQKPLKGASPSATTTIRLQASSTSPAWTQLTKESANVVLHLLPKLDLASVAVKYAQSGTPPSQITVQSVDADIRSKSPLHRQASLTFSTARHGDRSRIVDHSSPHSSESVTGFTASPSTRAISIPILAFAHHRNLVGPTTCT
jgi:hypothetical protein